jgi:hypothetical protein
MKRRRSAGVVRTRIKSPGGEIMETTNNNIWEDKGDEDEGNFSTIMAPDGRMIIIPRRANEQNYWELRQICEAHLDVLKELHVVPVWRIERGIAGPSVYDGKSLKEIMNKEFPDLNELQTLVITYFFIVNINFEECYRELDAALAEKQANPGSVL